MYKLISLSSTFGPQTPPDVFFSQVKLLSVPSLERHPWIWERLSTYILTNPAHEQEAMLAACHIFSHSVRKPNPIGAWTDGLKQFLKSDLLTQHIQAKAEVNCHAASLLHVACDLYRGKTFATLNPFFPHLTASLQDENPAISKTAAFLVTRLFFEAPTAESASPSILKFMEEVSFFLSTQVSDEHPCLPEFKLCLLFVLHSRDKTLFLDRCFDMLESLLIHPNPYVHCTAMIIAHHGLTYALEKKDTRLHSLLSKQPLISSLVSRVNLTSSNTRDLVPMFLLFSISKYPDSLKSLLENNDFMELFQKQLLQPKTPISLKDNALVFIRHVFTCGQQASLEQLFMSEPFIDYLLFCVKDVKDSQHKTPVLAQLILLAALSQDNPAAKTCAVVVLRKALYPLPAASPLLLGSIAPVCLCLRQSPSFDLDAVKTGLHILALITQTQQGAASFLSYREGASWRNFLSLFRSWPQKTPPIKIAPEPEKVSDSIKNKTKAREYPPDLSIKILSTLKNVLQTKNGCDLFFSVPDNRVRLMQWFSTQALLTLQVIESAVPHLSRTDLIYFTTSLSQLSLPKRSASYPLVLRIFNRMTARLNTLPSEEA